MCPWAFLFSKIQQMANILRVRIYSVQEYKTRSVRVFFEVTNKGKSPIRVSRRHTPLEGLLHDSLLVKRNGKIVRYDGLHAKRLLPSHEDYFELQPDESKSTEVDLSQGYSMSNGGRVSVRFKSTNLKAYVLGQENAPVTVSTPEAKFKVSKAPVKQPRPTIGEMNRAIPMSAIAEENQMLNPIIQGGHGRDAILLGALQEAFSKCQEADTNLDGLPTKYSDWFGQRTSDRFDQVRGVYQSIMDRMKTVQFTYICEKGTSDGIAASTSRGGSIIHIYDPFWALDPEGIESQVGCLVHEHSHASGNTIDVPKDGGGLGPDYYKRLALRNANQAINCAYNFEYYAVC
jgi:hypothetical protein